MKPIKDCEWSVWLIHNHIAKRVRWQITTGEKAGMRLIDSDVYFKNDKQCISHFEAFAKINGITNYKFA